MRIEVVHHAKAELVLFCEYIPHNLLEWLRVELAKGDGPANVAVRFVESRLGRTIRFMNNHGLAHFDTHFENIQTDGRSLYFGDFGLRGPPTRSRLSLSESGRHVS